MIGCMLWVVSIGRKERNKISKQEHRRCIEKEDVEASCQYAFLHYVKANRFLSISWLHTFSLTFGTMLMHCWHTKQVYNNISCALVQSFTVCLTYIARENVMERNLQT